jgi:hypothetical protein
MVCFRYKGAAKIVQHMWYVKTKVIPIVMGATGTISESFRKYLFGIPGKHEI